MRRPINRSNATATASASTPIGLSEGHAATHGVNPAPVLVPFARGGRQTLLRWGEALLKLSAAFAFGGEIFDKRPEPLVTDGFELRHQGRNAVNCGRHVGRLMVGLMVLRFFAASLLMVVQMVASFVT